MNVEPTADRVVSARVGRFKLNVHAPCTESWDGMTGDDRERFCARCALPVHDLSAMNDADALTLLTAPDDRVCVRYGVRADGTVVTGGRGVWIRRVVRAALVAVVSAGF